MYKQITLDGQSAAIHVEFNAIIEKRVDGKRWHVVSCYFEEQPYSIVHQIKIERQEDFRSAIEKFEKDCISLFNESDKNPEEMTILRELGYVPKDEFPRYISNS